MCYGITCLLYQREVLPYSLIVIVTMSVIINCNVCKGPECRIKFVLIALLSQNFVCSNAANGYIILVTVKRTANRTISNSYHVCTG